MQSWYLVRGSRLDTHIGLPAIAVAAPPVRRWAVIAVVLTQLAVRGSPRW